MKRIGILLLGLLLLIGCTVSKGADASAKADVPTATPPVQEIAIDVRPSARTGEAEPAELPTAQPITEAVPMPEDLPLLYSYYLEGNYAEEGDFFTYDIDGDGIEENMGFRIRTDDWRVEICVGEQSMGVGAIDLVGAILTDLDPSQEGLNLLVIVDQASADYMTVEVHLENGRLVNGATVYGDCDWEDGALWITERTDIYGTRYGKRTYSGAQLTPDTEWLIETYVPTEEQLRSERKDLIENGVLLHAAQDIPCRIDGADAVIPKGAYAYVLRYTADASTAELMLEDGAVATVFGVWEDYTYRIGGVPQDICFDNIFYAD